MAKKPVQSSVPSRPQLLGAALCLLVGVFSALKAGFDYLAASRVSGLYIALALLGLALGGRVLRRVKDNR